MMIKIKPDPSKDQHFLIDRKKIKKIVDCAVLKKDDIVFEVGAGIGSITKEIAAACKVIAVELDHHLVLHMQENLQENKNIEIVEGNALQKISVLHFNKIISSTPYSICEPLMKKLMQIPFDCAVLLVPEGFYELLAKMESVLSILAQAFFDTEFIDTVKKESFEPMPKVDSVLIVIKKKKNPSIENRLIQHLYTQRDKKVKNAVREAIIKIYSKTKKESRKIIDSMQLQPKTLEKLAENIDIKEYKQIIDAVSQLN